MVCVWFCKDHIISAVGQSTFRLHQWRGGMNLSGIEDILDLLQKTIKIVLQFGIGVGALIIIIYTSRAGYYPTGLTAGDALLFVAATLGFWFSYSMVVFILFCTAVTLSPLWRMLLALFIRLCKLVGKGECQVEGVRFPPLTADGIVCVPIGFLGIAFIALSLSKGVDLFIGLLGSVVMMALGYSFMNVDNPSAGSGGGANPKRKARPFMLFMIYFSPLLVGGFQGGLLDQSMRLIGVRNESAVVKFKRGYQNFVQSELGEKRATYKAIVIFHGLGTSSVLEISGKRFVVPNNSYFLRYE